MSIDIDDIICDAQDYYFEQRYQDAISILEEAKKTEKDVGICEMLVMCYLELKEYKKAFENAKEWRSIAKRDTIRKCMNALMRTAYLSDEKETLKSICREMIEIDENIEEALIVYYDAFHDEKEWVSQQVTRKKRQQPKNDLLKEIERRIKKDECDEKERFDEVGDVVYSIGLMITISDLMHDNDDEEKKKLVALLNEIKGENNVIHNAINLLNNDEVSSHGIHILLRKYGNKL